MTWRSPLGPARRQSGFNLVELMIAMVVSLILMLGIVTLLLANQQSYRTQSEFAVLNQNARLARYVLDNAIAHAGHVAGLGNQPAHVFAKYSSDKGRFVQLGFIAEENPDNKATDPLGESDRITIRFQATGGINDCIGSAVGSTGTPVTTAFELYVDDDNELQCDVHDGDNRPLISNVVLMKARYGLDLPDDSDRGVDYFARTLDKTNRDQVRSVRVQVLLKSNSELREAKLTEGFDIAGYDKAFMPEDRQHAYVMVDKVIALHNLLP